MSVERRARMHAALGEPARLVVVDRLAFSDASPGDLSRVLGIGTNLMAHHLRVLAEAGLVRRVRSEGDARRVYVQLCLDDPAVAALLGTCGGDPGAGALPAEAASRVVFVCTHNSARSQLATWAWREVSTVPATSAGTHPAGAVHPRAVSAARRHHLHPGATRTSDVHEVLRPGDLVVAVCDNAHEELASTAAGPRENWPTSWLHWSVPDPVRVDSDEAFESAFEALTHRVDRLATALERDGEAGGPTAR